MLVFDGNHVIADLVGEDFGGDGVAILGGNDSVV
jgi:hypothetical protein